MNKMQCKGLKPTQLSDEIREVFVTHIEIVGDPNLKWDRLFRFLVMENAQFPIEEEIEPICADFFSALHRNDVERFGSTIEAHTRAFGIWFPRYWKNVTLRRSGELLYGQTKVADTNPEPTPGRPATGSWNMTQGLGIAQIRRVVSTYDMLMANGSSGMVKSAGEFISRCRESIRRYDEKMAQRMSDSEWSK